MLECWAEMLLLAETLVRWGLVSVVVVVVVGHLLYLLVGQVVVVVIVVVCSAGRRASLDQVSPCC